MDISYSQFRQNLKAMIDKVIGTHEPFYITTHKERKAVLVSYEDYESLTETAYLLKNPAMAKRVLNAVIDLKAGKGNSHELIGDET